MGKLIQNLEARFPERLTIKCFSILDGKSLPDDEELATYGNEQLEALWERYATKLKLHDEWDSLKYELSESHRGDSMDKVKETVYYIFANIELVLRG